MHPCAEDIAALLVQPRDQFAVLVEDGRLEPDDGSNSLLSGALHGEVYWTRV